MRDVFVGRGEPRRVEKTAGSVCGEQIIAVTARFVLNLHHDLKSNRCACLCYIHLNDVVAELIRCAAAGTWRGSRRQAVAAQPLRAVAFRRNDDEPLPQITDRSGIIVLETLVEEKASPFDLRPINPLIVDTFLCCEFVHEVSPSS